MNDHAEEPCAHDDWIVNAYQEQYCPACDETFFDMIKRLEYDNMILNRILEKRF